MYVGRTRACLRACVCGRVRVRRTGCTCTHHITTSKIHEHVEAAHGSGVISIHEEAINLYNLFITIIP